MAQTPEQKRAYYREYNAKHREHKRQAAQQWRDENLERSRESRRRYVQEHREEVRAAARRKYWANQEEEKQGRRLRRLQPGGKTPRERRRDEIVGQLWHEQEGCCYLCNEYVAPEKAVLEHDHRCCPLNSFCAYCVRGVAHQECNKVIGHSGDDPDRLELIAFNLRAKLTEIAERLAEKPSQAELGA